MSGIECKYCLISTSYLTGLFDIFMFISDRIVCVLVTFYQSGHFVMLYPRGISISLEFNPGHISQFKTRVQNHTLFKNKVAKN